MNKWFFLSFPFGAMLSALLTWAALGYARYAALWDQPGHRSSHVAPTPRGGGIAIVLVTLLASTWLWATGRLDVSLWLALSTGGSLVAAVGWLDDHGHVPAGIRAMAHAAGALLLVHFMGWPHELRVGVFTLSVGWAGAFLFPLWAMWLVNLFNFMDGIDGIAATQSALVAVTGAILLLHAAQPGLSLLALTVGGGSLGFLVWNWQPARIFMGDVGSGFLGYAMAFLALAGELSQTVPLLVWMLMLGVFLFDATVTLLRRMTRGERWLQPHRSHAYQRLVQAGLTHSRVTTYSALLTVGLIGIGLVTYFRPWLTLPALVVEAVVLTGLYRAVETVYPISRSA